MKAPIIIENSGDLLIFESADKAERYIEPIDVQNQEYMGYDSEGRLLLFYIQHPNKVFIQTAESEPLHQNELRNVLIDFLERIGVSSEEIKYLPLSDLVAKVLEYKRE